MLEKVEVRTERGLLLTLPMQDISEGYSIQDIDGLDPVKVTVVSSAFAQMDGELYQGSRREKRNMVITLGLEPDYIVGTVQELRKRLYTFFMPKSKLQFRFFHTDEPIFEIWGTVESMDSPKFIQEPMAVISVLCFDPDFYNPTPLVLAGNTTSSTTEISHDYDGTVETGIKFTLNVNRTLPEFTIYHRPPDNSLRSLEFSVATSLVSGDKVTISTAPGNKYAILTRSG